MIVSPVTFKFIKPDNCIPHYFTEEEVSRIFNACHNLKHLAMLTTMFYECLRVSELCALNDDDIDFEAMTLRVRGKGGREDMVPLNSEVAAILKELSLNTASDISERRTPGLYHRLFKPMASL